MYKFYQSIPYGRRSNIIDKWGEVAHEPTRDIILINEETGELFVTNDLATKLYNRNKKIKKLYNFYRWYFLKRQISVVVYVVNVKSISTISNHLKNLKRKFIKKHIQLLAYYWQRDIGEIVFEAHYHVILILPRIDIKLFNELFMGKCKSGAKAEFCKDLSDFTRYLNKKEIFAPHKKRSNSISRKLLKPTFKSDNPFS